MLFGCNSTSTSADAGDASVDVVVEDVGAEALMSVMPTQPSTVCSASAMPAVSAVPVSSK